VSRKYRNLLAVLAASVLLGGCSQMDGNDGSGSEGAPKPAPVRPEDEVRQRVIKASSQILDIIALKAKTKDSMPFTLECSGYPEQSEVQRYRHTWSLWEAPDNDLTAAMGRLRTQLPRNGWEIVKDGIDDSRKGAPQIVVNSTDGEASADLRLRLVPPGGEYQSAIVVTVVSKCFRPEKSG
jgi:hypothetical protein